MLSAGGVSPLSVAIMRHGAGHSLTHTFGCTMGTNSQTQMELFPNYFSITRQLSNAVAKLSSSRDTAIDNSIDKFI